jgi:hypothetical protein
MEAYEYMDSTKSELVQILYSLQSHWNVIEEELIEINKDITHMRECLAKYGEHFRIPLEYLKDLKREKKEIMKKIIENMDNFEGHIQGSRSLVQDLNRTKFVEHQGNILQRGKESSIYRPPMEVLSTGNDTVFVTTSYQTPVHHYKMITKTPMPVDTRSKYSKTIGLMKRNPNEL